MVASDQVNPGSLAFVVRRVWLAMRTAIGAELAEFGLSTPQYATLMMAASRPGMSVADIAREVGSTRQAANEMLVGLERENLIERHPHPNDRRVHQIHVTAAGRTRLADAGVAVARREAELEAGFSPEQLGLVHGWLLTIPDKCH
ncbi:MarR family winged helix-turn-helix transcriptional regulator [Actinokineospora enzanensis]|uniref:MarR family winged helix-turn-helix transcriptional regulator n=1 Tax=Actinokineospora enzanensis TaxID=155975 RepID=UPI00038171F7|nr:MarR family transcriptional regulator [Actinokineospora enzanensis]